MTRHRCSSAAIGAKQGGTPERHTANRPSANLVNQQQPKRTSTQKLQGRGGWARFVKGLGAVQTRGTPERRTANRPSANLVNQQQPKRTATQKLQGRAGWARFVKGLRAVLPLCYPPRFSPDAKVDSAHPLVRRCCLMTPVAAREARFLRVLHVWVLGLMFARLNLTK